MKKYVKPEIVVRNARVNSYIVCTTPPSGVKGHNTNKWSDESIVAYSPWDTDNKTTTTNIW